MSRRLLAMPVAIIALTLAITSCSSSKKKAPSSPPGSPSGASSVSSASGAPGSGGASSSAQSSGSSAAGPSTLFGPECATLGLDNPAVAGATAAPVGTVAANIPFLKNVVTAANAAGLLNTLNAAPALTVFAPVDDAFKKEPPGLLQSLLTDPSKKPQLVATLKYHVVAGKIAKAQLAGKHTTLEGKSLTVAGSGDAFTVNGTAKVICGGLQTKNAVVYLIDTVLHPPAS